MTEASNKVTIKYGLVFILSGAFGNLIDRYLNGKVVDFLDFMIGDYHWYVFNVADSSVTVGMILFVIHSIFYNQDNTRHLSFGGETKLLTT